MEDLRYKGRTKIEYTAPELQCLGNRYCWQKGSVLLWASMPDKPHLVTDDRAEYSEEWYRIGEVKLDPVPPPMPKIGQQVQRLSGDWVDVLGVYPAADQIWVEVGTATSPHAMTVQMTTIDGARRPIRDKPK